MPGPTLLEHVAARVSCAGVSAMTSAKTIRRFRTLPTTCLTRGCGERYEEVAMECLSLPPAMPDEPCLERSLVQSSQAFRHRRPQQRCVRDREQVLGDEPHLFLGGHPIEIVESHEIHRPRERAERSLAPKVEVRVEVAHHKLAQRAMDRLAVREAVVVRLGDRTPVAAILEDRDDVIGVMFGFEVEEERGITQRPERSRREYCGLKAVRCALAQDSPRRPCGRAEVVRHVVEELLNTVRGLERAERSQLRRVEAIIHRNILVDKP